MPLKTHKIYQAPPSRLQKLGWETEGMSCLEETFWPADLPTGCVESSMGAAFVHVGVGHTECRQL